MSTTSKGAELALNELKKQAKILGKNADRGAPAAQARLAGIMDPQHKHLLGLVSKHAGFRDWQQARRILSGQGRPGDDFGTLWHGRPSGGFLNEWHACYEEARASWAKQSSMFLLPYKTQFVLVGQEFMRHLGVSQECLSRGRDLLAEDPENWDQLCRQRLRAIFVAN